MTQVQLQVPEIHCGNCKNSIESAVGAIDGVMTVEVSVPETTVDVSFDEGAVAIDAIKETIESQGYVVFG